jgi:hypothetical protein
MKTTAPRNRIRRFVFTLNNYTEAEFAAIKQFPCKWMIVGKEVGEKGTPHLQGACVIGKQIAFSRLKTTRGFERCHIEKMNGTPSDSRRYCSKYDGHPFEKGSIPQPGKRNDIISVVEKLREGQTLESVIRTGDLEDIPAIVRYAKGFQYISSVLTPHRTEPPVIVWLYGPTGIGKTRCVLELGISLGGEQGPWISSGSLRWFDGYWGQSVAIFDDLRTKHAPFHFLLRLLDRYPCSVEIKGATVKWVPHFIFITAPKKPREMWNLRTEEDIAQLERRVTHTINAGRFLEYSGLLSFVQDKITPKGQV